MGKNTGVTLGRGRGDKCPFNILTKKFFLVPELKRANKIWMSGGKGYMSINNWFKPIFPSF